MASGLGPRVWHMVWGITGVMLEGRLFGLELLSVQ